MRGQETVYVISGPMRGLGKNCIKWRKQTHRTTNRWTWLLYDYAVKIAQKQVGLMTKMEIFCYKDLEQQNVLVL